MQCPRCNCNNAIIKMKFVGSTINKSSKANSNRSFSSDSKQPTFDSRYQAIGFCKNCGNTWQIISPPIKQKDSTSDFRPSMFILFIILVICLMVSNCHNKKKDREEDREKEMISDTNSIWAPDYTSIEDFDWSTNENGITLERYHGDDKKIRINSSYTVNGVEYQVTKLEGCFSSHDVESIIICEGVTEIVGYTFNGCDVEYLYMPASLVEFDGWGYFHHLKSIDYGGTREQWEEVFDTKYLDESVQIEYCVDPDELR